MSIQAMVWVLEHSQAKLADKLVALSIANHADAGGRCWPSQAQIAREASITDRQVRRCVQRLFALGELLIVGAGFRGVHIYELVMNKALTEGETIPDKLSSVNNATPEELSAVTPDISCTTPDRMSDKPSIEPSSKPRKKSSAPASVYDFEFEKWWDLVWRKDGKEDAQNAYRRKRKEGLTAEFLLAESQRYRTSREGQERKYDLMPATWLNKRRWEDRGIAESIGSITGPTAPPPIDPSEMTEAERLRWYPNGEQAHG